MDKVALLTASKVEPGASINPRSDITRLLVPTLALVLRFQSIIGSVSVFICLRAYLLASAVFAGALSATRIVAFQAIVTAKLGAFHGFTMSSKTISDLWNSRSVQTVRRKVFYEFAVFILGTGNVMIVLLFWPGWWLLAGIFWVVWKLWG